MSDRPQRVSRKLSQAQTRERLIDAALQEASEVGFSATSIRRVCERAGHSQGAFYSNFESKDALMLDVVRTHMARIARGFAAAVEAGPDRSLAAELERLKAELARVSANPVLTRLIAELNLHAQRNEGFAERFTDAATAYQRDFLNTIEGLLARHDLAPRQSAREIADTMTAIWFGCVVQPRSGNDIPVEELLMAYFRAVTLC